MFTSTWGSVGPHKWWKNTWEGSWDIERREKQKWHNTAVCPLVWHIYMYVYMYIYKPYRVQRKWKKNIHLCHSDWFLLKLKLLSFFFFLPQFNGEFISSCSLLNLKKKHNLNYHWISFFWRYQSNRSNILQRISVRESSSLTNFDLKWDGFRHEVRGKNNRSQNRSGAA